MNEVCARTRASVKSVAVLEHALKSATRGLCTLVTEGMILDSELRITVFRRNSSKENYILWVKKYDFHMAQKLVYEFD